MNVRQTIDDLNGRLDAIPRRNDDSDDSRESDQSALDHLVREHPRACIAVAVTIVALAATVVVLILRRRRH